MLSFFICLSSFKRKDSSYLFHICLWSFKRKNLSSSVLSTNDLNCPKNSCEKSELSEILFEKKFNCPLCLSYLIWSVRNGAKNCLFQKLLVFLNLCPERKKTQLLVTLVKELYKVMWQTLEIMISQMNYVMKSSFLSRIQKNRRSFAPHLMSFQFL